MSNLIGYTQFTASKVGKTGLTVTVDVKSVNRSSGATATVATGASATELIRGVYFYLVTTANLQTFDYVFMFITSDGTVDQQELPALWTRFSEAVATDSNGLVTLAPVTHAGATIPAVTLVSTLATYMGDTPQTGDSYARIGAAGAGLTAVGDARLANLDAAISTRSTYAGGDTSGTTTLLARLTGTRATNLDNLDAAISSRSTYAGGAVSSVSGAVGSVAGNVGGSVASVSAGVTVTTNNDKTGYKMAPDGFDSVVIEAGINARQAEALILAAAAGKASGLDANAPVFKGANNTTTRIAATTDSNGNRTAVTLTPPA